MISSDKKIEKKLRYMGMKEKIAIFKESLKKARTVSKGVLDELTLNALGMTTGDIINNLKSGITSKFKSSQFIGTISHLSEYITKLLAFLFITVFAFYPQTIMNLFWIFLIILIVLSIAIIILVIFFPHIFFHQAYVAVSIKGFNYFGEEPFSIVLKLSLIHI